MKKGLIWLSAIVLGLLSSIGIASAQTGYNGCEMMNWMGGGFGMGFFAFVTWILFIAVLILSIIWLVKQINKKK